LPYYDLPEDDLRAYAPDVDLPPDLAEFWARTIEPSLALAKPAQFEPADTGLRLVDTYDVTFSGFAGDPVRAWFHVPASCAGPLPVVVRYQGYGGGRGLAVEADVWALAGYACLVVDTRGQGSAWSPGDTADPGGSGPAHPGFMTRGILDPDDYYYRRVFTDSVLAVHAVRSHPLVRADRVVVTGASQGGGISLAVASLVPDIAGVMADVPFLCHFRRATRISGTGPYGEINRYLSVHRDQTEAVFSTLAYFDCASLVSRAQAPALFSVALMDQTCPPSTVYAVYNRYGGRKEIVEYPFNDHEGGLAFQRVLQLRWLAKLWG
jgi:cephalosporin-C deacetylase